MNDRPKRRWLQFSVRSLLLAVLIISLLLSWNSVRVQRLRREQAQDAAAWIQIARERPWIISPSKFSDDEWEAYVALQIELIRSPMVLSSAARNPKTAANVPGDPVRWMSDRIRVTRVGETDLLEVWFEHPDPNVRDGVVNAVVQEYLKIYDGDKTMEALEQVKLIEYALDEHRAKWRSLQEDIRALSREFKELAADGEEEAHRDLNSAPHFKESELELQYKEWELAEHERIVRELLRRRMQLRSELRSPARVIVRKQAG
jgi:hypothetical protein